MSPAKKKAFKARMAAGRAAKAGGYTGPGSALAGYKGPAIKGMFGHGMPRVPQSGFARAPFPTGGTPAHAKKTAPKKAAPKAKKPAGARRAKKIVKAVVKAGGAAQKQLKKEVKKVEQKVAAVAKTVAKKQHWNRKRAEAAIKSAATAVAKSVEAKCDEKIKAVEKRAMDAFALGNIGRGIRAAHRGGMFRGEHPMPGKAAGYRSDVPEAASLAHSQRMKMQHGREMAALRKRAEQAMALGNIGRPFRAAGEHMFRPPAPTPGPRVHPPGVRPPKTRGGRPGVRGGRPGVRGPRPPERRREEVRPSRIGKQRGGMGVAAAPVDAVNDIIKPAMRGKGKRGVHADWYSWVCAGPKRSGCGGGPEGGHVLGDLSEHKAVRMR